MLTFAPFVPRSEKPVSALLGRAVKLELREINLEVIASGLVRQQFQAATTTTHERKLTIHWQYVIRTAPGGQGDAAPPTI